MPYHPLAEGMHHDRLGNNNPYLRSLRQKLVVRNVVYAVGFLITTWVLYSLLLPREALPDMWPGAERPSVRPSWDECAEQVKRAFLHGYHGYERLAAPHDELRPISGEPRDNFNGWGVTVFDALDTMILLGAEDEYLRARKIVEEVEFDLPDHRFVPYFETVIRYLGGLLSAYALNHDALLLARAEELAQKLEPVFDTPTGLALYGVNPSNGEVVGPEVGILAEIGSLQLEYSYLAKLTGKKKYYRHVEKLVRAFGEADLRETGGMLPIGWSLSTGVPVDARLSAGAQADSAHEYLLKQYLLTSKSDKTSLEMYLRATTQILSNLLYLSATRHLLYVTDTTASSYDERAKPSHVMEHLSCFLPGLLALGVHTLPWDDLDSLGLNLNDLADKYDFGSAGDGYRRLKGYKLKDLHMWAAEGLAQTCWLMYADQPSGLGPDEVIMRPDAKSMKGKGTQWMDVMDRWKISGSRGSPPGVQDTKPISYTEEDRLRGSIPGRDYTLKRRSYLLRPETLESIYLMWRVTGDPKWRERGWLIFQSIEKHTKTPNGYASLRSVDRTPPPKDDDMPSYFLAETLKYLYLMFADGDPIPLDQWVFNTEAHALPVFEWTLDEKIKFNL